MQSKTVSFIIPLFNHLEDTKAMLSSLVQTLPSYLDYEIIFVDDYSTDGTRSWLEYLHDPRIRFALNPQNLGYAKANNVGARLARGQILGLLNNDLIFSVGWFEPMLEALEAEELKAGIVGNVQFRADDQQLDHAGVELNYRAQFVHIRELPKSDLHQPIELDAVTGACVLIHKADFDGVGGFDESFVNGCEDVDLCLKLSGIGKKIYLVPQSQIRHRVSLSRAKALLQNQRNSQMLFGKWRPQIQKMLANQWHDLLQKGPDAYRQFIDGDFTDQFLADISSAAMRIAESMILREEYQWLRALEKIDPNANLANRFEIEGLIPIPGSNTYLAEHEFELRVKNVQAVRNFFVCGSKINAQVSGPMAFTITIDDNQTKTYVLPRGEATINLGIVDPILDGTASSRFRVRVDYVDDQNQYLQDAGKTTLISHFVLDGQTIAAIS